MKRVTVWRAPGAAWFAGGVVVAGLVLGVVLVHRDAATSAPTTAVVAPSPAAAAIRAAIDPETGTLGLPAGDAAMALELPAEPRGEAPVRVLADGTIQVDLRGRGRSYAVARFGADGKLATGCAAGARDARQFLLGAGAETNKVDGRDVK